MTFYVSPRGNDAWSGRLPDGNPQGSDGPFLTARRARDAVRALPGPRGPVQVTFRGGVHFLDGPLLLTAEDGGSAGASVTYAAAPGESPVLSGGRRISGWRAAVVNGQEGWVAEVPEVSSGRWTFHELWVNGERRLRPRLPKTGFHRIAGVPGVGAETPWQEGQDHFTFAPGAIDADWRNLTDIEAVVLHFWVDSHLPLTSVDPARHLATCGRTSVFRLTDDYRATGPRYYLENVFEALTEPGEWYLDRSAGLLYYLPLPGEDMARAETIAPALTQLVRLQGEAGPAAGRPVCHVVLRGLTFSHAEWRLPAGGRAGSPQAARDVPAAVHLEDAHDCAILD